MFRAVQFLILKLHIFVSRLVWYRACLYCCTFRESYIKMWVNVILLGNCCINFLTNLNLLLKTAQVVPFKTVKYYFDPFGRFVYKGVAASK